MNITIDGTKYEVAEVYLGDYLARVRLFDHKEFYLAPDAVEAGKQARIYWEDLINNDPDEFAEIVGKGTLVAWALGRPASPGSIAVRSLEEWLNLTVTCPEEEWGRYDGLEYRVNGADEALIEELGFIPTVAYRCN